MKTRNADYMLNLKDLTAKTKMGAAKEKRTTLKAMKITLYEQVKAMYLNEKKKVRRTFNELCQSEKNLGYKLDLGIIDSKLQGA